jgi:hypothetical protein
LSSAVNRKRLLLGDEQGEILGDSERADGNRDGEQGEDVFRKAYNDDGG